jgi:hypothetical protein
MKVLLMLFPMLALAQNPLAGKKYSETIPVICESCDCTGHYTTLAFTADSVTVESITFGGCGFPGLEKTQSISYKYKMSIAGDSIYLDIPSNDHYIIREGKLVSDCTYNRGRQYFEISSD